MTQSLAEANSPLRVLVVDDEELARLRLKSLVGECGEPTAVVVGEAANAAQALVWLATRSCDLLLLDVQMPGRDGTQLAAELRLRSPAPAIVFVTAHAEHALKAFDLEAVDYLTKPVKRERLQAALRRVAQRLGAPAAPGVAVKAEEEGPVIVVSDRGRIIRVPVADVLYMKAELKYVTLRTADHTHVPRRFARRARGPARRPLPARPSQRAGRPARRARPRAARDRRRERRRRPRRLGRLHRAGQRVARGVAAPGRGGARGAGRGRAVSRSATAARRRRIFENGGVKSPRYRLSAPYGIRPIVVGLAALALGGLAVIAWLASSQDVSPAEPPKVFVAPGAQVASVALERSAPASAAVVAPTGERDSELVEICGLGWVEAKADANFIEPEVFAQIPGIEASVRGIVAGLRESPDTFAQAVGIVLEMKGGPDGAGDAALIEQLARQAATTDDPRVYALAFRVCSRTPSEGSCALLGVGQWARLDEGNAAPWLFALDDAAARNDRAQVDEALYRIGSAARFDDRVLALSGPIVARAGASDSDLMAAQMLATQAVGIAAALSLPLQRLTRACGGTQLADVNRKQVCDAIAATLGERSDSMLVSMIGASLGRRVDWPTERVVAIRVLSVALSDLWSSDTAADPRFGISYNCKGVRTTLARLDRLARVGEPQVAREWIATNGKPFESYARVAREQEARRSAREAEETSRRAAPARAASATE